MKFTSLLKDPNYSRGFGVRGLGLTPDDLGVKKEFHFGQDLPPVWQIAQWAARYDLANDEQGSVFEVSPGVFKMQTKTNTLIADTVNRSLSFKCYAEYCYDKPRKKNDPWQHLLVENSFAQIDDGAPLTRITKLDSLTISGSIQLLEFEDHMGDLFDSETHAAQFLLYLTIHNVEKNSSGFGEMIWFGIPFFDNRFKILEPSAMFDKGTSCLMVSIGSKAVFLDSGEFFRNGKIIAGENSPVHEFEVNALDLIKSAYETARLEGYFLNTQLQDLAVTGMNMGWEMPGTYNVAMRVNSFDVIAGYND